MGFLSSLVAGETDEVHDDGSVTTRYRDGTSTTSDRDGNIREKTSHETALPLGMGKKVTVTRDGDGKVINTQDGWGR